MPLCNADLYRILPRPYGRNWGGIEYYDPAAGKGVVYLFKPAATSNDVQTIRLRGVQPQAHDRLTFTDGTNPNGVKTGEELQQGIKITLQGSPVSELMFLEKIP